MKRIMQLAAIACFSSVAFAGTPDGQTPAEETYCDDQTGAAFGICNAYCEAMDCGDDNQRASDRACEQKERQYLRITGEPMPTCGSAPPPPPPVCEEICDAQYEEDIAFCDDSEPPPPQELKNDPRTGTDPITACFEFAKAAWRECLFECDGGIDECVPNFSGICILPDFETERISYEIEDSCTCADLGGRWETESRR